jgi:LL-diaminopimelate aminotransferase
VRALTDYYMKNAALIREEMTALGYACVGGENSPYIWIDGRRDSWAFFDLLLERAGVVCTPGVGFGKCGSGYIRISAFNDAEKVQQAMGCIRDALKGE